MLAARSGSVEAAKALRALRRDARAKDSKGKSALDYAKGQEMKDYIKALTGEGKDK
jgi:hypothetical protein